MPRKTISDVIANAAATPKVDLGSAPEAEAVEEVRHQPRKFPLPDTDSVKAAGGAAIAASMALASRHPVAGTIIGAAVFGATCIAESMLRQEGQK